MKQTLFLAAGLLLAAIPASAQWSGLDANAVSIHGFVSQGFLYTTDNDYLTAKTEDGSFEFSEIGLTFSATLSDRLRVGAQVISRDLGALGNHQPELDWGYGDYRLYDWLGIRVGRVKNPMGLMNETRDLDTVRTQILMPVTYDDRYRDIHIASDGGALYGFLPIGFAGSLAYQGFVGTIDYGKDSVIETVNERNSPGSDVRGIQIRSVMGGKLDWNTPLDGLMFGASYLNGQQLDLEIEAGPPAPAGLVLKGGFPVFHVWYFYSEYRTDWFRLSAEHARTEAVGELKSETPPLSAPFEARDGSWYVHLDGYVTDWLTAGLSYGEFYVNWHDQDGSLADEANPMLGGAVLPRWTRWHKETALSLRFDANESWSFKLEGRMIDGAGRLILPDQEGGVDGTERFWNLFAAKTTFTF